MISKILRHPCFINASLKVFFENGAVLSKRKQGPLLGNPGDIIESIEIILHEENYVVRINETNVVDIFADSNVFIRAQQIQIYSYYGSQLYDGNSIHDLMI